MQKPTTRCAPGAARGNVELAPGRVISTTLYNGQFPGPLLRFTEGKRTIVDIYNDTDIPEVAHWHGQMIPSEVDGAIEEGTPVIPPHGMRRISFTPKPSGFRFLHTHVIAGSDLGKGTYSGQAKVRLCVSASRRPTQLAQLGGYLARAGDAPPGNMVIWRGLARLTDIEIGFLLGAQNVGN